jgi:hypothetical protein
MDYDSRFSRDGKGEENDRVRLRESNLIGYLQLRKGLPG